MASWSAGRRIAEHAADTDGGDSEWSKVTSDVLTGLARIIFEVLTPRRTNVEHGGVPLPQPFHPTDLGDTEEASSDQGTISDGADRFEGMDSGFLPIVLGRGA